MGFGFNNHLGSRFGFNAGGLSNYSGQSFSIAKSFYFNGVNQSFYTSNVKLDPYINGTLKKFSIITTVKRTSLGGSQGLFGDGTSKIYFDFDASNKLKLRTRLTTDKFCTSTLSYNDTTNFYTVAFTFDGTQTLGNRTKLYVNGALISFNDQTHEGIDNATGVWSIGSRGSVVDYFNGYQGQFTLCNDVLTDAEILSHYNNGKPKDSQALFGSKCKLFFNPDNSGDTAQFTVTDSVNSINFISDNLSNENKTPITPYADPIANLVTKYGFLNAWSGENIGINGTTTTAKDYLSEHDLANPTVASQLAFNGASSDFGNRPILVADGIDDILLKSVTSWRNSDTSGIIVMVVKQSTTTTAGFFSAGLTTSDNNRFELGAFSNRHRLIVGNTESLRAGADSNAKVSIAANNGSNSNTYTNGVLDTFIDNNDFWNADNGSNYDFIAIGGSNRLTPSYVAGDIAFIGYLPYTTEANLLAMSNELQTIFNIP